MDIWAMRFPDTFIGVQFLSDRAKAWAAKCEYCMPVDGVFVVLTDEEYQEMLNNLAPGLSVLYDEGRSH